MNCTEKTIALGASDSDCLGGLSAQNTCGGHGPCFEGGCCCSEPAMDNKNMCIDIDECASEPCQNNGTCFNQNAYYECECTEGIYLVFLSNKDL